MKYWCRGINICRVGGVSHNVVKGKTLCNVFLTFKILVIQVLLQLQKGGRNFIKILGISLADSNETLPFKFCNRNHQRRRDKRNQNVDSSNAQYGFKLTKSRRKMVLLSSHRYQLKQFLSKTFPHLWKRQQYSILLYVKNMTLHFVDLERSLKSFLTSQNAVCLLTLFSSEEMALIVFWLIGHVHRNEKRVNDVTQ